MNFVLADLSYNIRGVRHDGYSNQDIFPSLDIKVMPNICYKLLQPKEQKHIFYSALLFGQSSVLSRNGELQEVNDQSFSDPGRDEKKKETPIFEG